MNAKVKALKGKLKDILTGKAVGQINPAPVIEVIFSTLAKTAIQMGERGYFYIVLEDTTVPGAGYTTFKSVADIKEAEWTAKNYQVLVSAFSLFAPNRVVVRRRVMTTDETPVLESIGDILAELKTKKVTHLAVPQITKADNATVVAWAKENVIKKGTVYVSAFADGADSPAVIELQSALVKHELIEGYTLGDLTVMIGGAVAGCPLNRSIDNIALPYISLARENEPVVGELCLYTDDDEVRIVSAVNSLVSFNSTWKADVRYIKIFEGINIVRFDIQDTFKDSWLGLYLNTYENKMAFCSIVNDVYFKELAPNVLSPDFDNRITIDVEKNRQHIITDGGDPDLMSETEIKMYPTGASVYLTGEVRFTNVMIDLTLEILY